MNATYILNQVMKHMEQDGLCDSLEHYVASWEAIQKCYEEIWDPDDFAQMSYLMAIGEYSIPDDSVSDTDTGARELEDEQDLETHC